jgi:hypothetical protein
MQLALIPTSFGGACSSEQSTSCFPIRNEVLLILGLDLGIHSVSVLETFLAEISMEAMGWGELRCWRLSRQVPHWT